MKRILIVFVNRGVGLMELMLAVALIAAIASSLSLLFPNASRSGVQNHQRFRAISLASSKLEDIQKAPYGVVGLTDSIYFLNTAGTHPCDCATEKDNIGKIPASGTLINSIPAGDTFVQNGVTYTRSVCINQESAQHGLTGADWTSMCPSTIPGWSETGLKSVHVRVTWLGVSGSTTNVDAQGVVYQ